MSIERLTELVSRFRRQVSALGPRNDAETAPRIGPTLDPALARELLE